MASLRLEDHVLTVVEHQALLFDYLNARSPSWGFGADLADGQLWFTDNATGNRLLTCSAFLIGSLSRGDNTFLWGWANPSVTQHPQITARWEKLRAQASAEGASVFTQEEPIGLSDENESRALAITATGALGGYTFYAGGYDGGAAFLAIDGAPDGVPQTADVLKKITIITTALSGVSFDHRAAVLAYLGQPTETTGDNLTFDVQGAPLTIAFDGQNRIVDMQFAAGPDNVAPRPPSEPKRGLFKRLFGG